MKQGFNVRFYARNCKTDKNGVCPLELALNINGTRKFINTQFRTTPAEFKRKRQPKELSDYMALMRTRVNEILTEMLRAGEAVTTQAIIGYLKNGGYKSYTVSDMFEEYLSILSARVGKNLSLGVYRKYELVRDLFYAFVNPDNECKSELTVQNVMRFKARVESKYEQSTAAGYLVKLKTMMQYALDNGKITKNPFQGIKIHKGEKKIEYLKKWEQDQLIRTEIPNDSLSRVRDCAVFQMATGLSYADLKELKPEDIKVKDGVRYIEKPRMKTGKVFCAVILQPGLDMLAKYGGCVPVLSNQKYNTYLRVIRDLCGIGTRLTTHVMRKTYATNLLNAGVRIETCAAALGHSMKICQKYYAHLQESSILGEISSKVG